MDLGEISRWKLSFKVRDQSVSNGLDPLLHCRIVRRGKSLRVYTEEGLTQAALSLLLGY